MSSRSVIAVVAAIVLAACASESSSGDVAPGDVGADEAMSFPTVDGRAETDEGAEPDLAQPDVAGDRSEAAPGIAEAPADADRETADEAELPDAETEPEPEPDPPPELPPEPLPELPVEPLPELPQDLAEMEALDDPGPDLAADEGPEVVLTPLDPDLATADPDGQVCETPGSMFECPSLQVCRFEYAEQSRCEGCDSCNNLGQMCMDGTDCDILFACYLGRCTNICPLGTNYCGPVEDCLDIGHPTHGVCDPFG